MLQRAPSSRKSPAPEGHGSLVACQHRSWVHPALEHPASCSSAAHLCWNATSACCRTRAVWRMATHLLRLHDRDTQLLRVVRLLGLVSLKGLRCHGCFLLCCFSDCLRGRQLRSQVGCHPGVPLLCILCLLLQAPAPTLSGLGEYRTSDNVNLHTRSGADSVPFIVRGVACTEALY